MEMLNRGAQQLLGRASGPLHLRFLMMPAVVTVLAIRAGLKDASEGQPAFLWAFLTKRAERPRLLRSALTHIGRILIVALVLDTIYQLIVLNVLSRPGSDRGRHVRCRAVRSFPWASRALGSLAS